MYQSDECLETLKENRTLVNLESSNKYTGKCVSYRLAKQQPFTSNSHTQQEDCLWTPTPVFVTQGKLLAMEKCL